MKNKIAYCKYSFEPSHLNFFTHWSCSLLVLHSSDKNQKTETQAYPSFKCKCQHLKTGWVLCKKQFRNLEFINKICNNQDDECFISGKNFWLISLPSLTWLGWGIIFVETNHCLEPSKKIIPSIFHMNSITNIIYCKINGVLYVVSIGDSRNKLFGCSAYDSERVRPIHWVQNNIKSTIRRKLLS